MIVEESDALLAALDRRLSVDRVLALEAETPNPDAARASRTSPSQGTAALAAHNEVAAQPVESHEQGSLAARLPLGRVVVARVIDVVDADHVVAEIDRWRVVLALPERGATMLPGDQRTLRVLANVPSLLFEDLDAGRFANDDEFADGGVATHWSRDAVELARQVGVDDARGTQTFTKPILDIVPVTGREATDPVASAELVAGQDVVARDPSSLVGTPPNAIVLQGPAWTGQPMEIVVRRDRADEAFDNAALDQWCGEIVIDLPRLGRVVGHLGWSVQGLRIRLEGEDDASTASMNAATPELAAALLDVALPLLSLAVGRPAPGGAPRHG